MKKEEGTITNLIKFYTLMLLFEKPRHGYEIMDELRKRTAKTASPGQMYPLLKRFRQLGYVTQKISGKKKRKIYFITPKGKKFASVILEKFSGVLDVAIRKKLVACACCKCEIYRGSYCAKVSGKTLNFCCKSCCQSFRK